MNIYIIFENANRELDYKLLLAANLLNNNNVIIGEKNEFRTKLIKLPPGIIIEKGLRKGSLERFKNWKKHGHKIFCFDEESLTYYDDRQYYSSNCDIGIENYVDKVFASSQRHFKTLSKRFNKNQIIICGIVKYELIKKKFHSLYHEEVKQIKKKFGKFILVTSRFGNINLNRKKKKNNYKKLVYKNYMNDSKIIFKDFKKIPERLSKAFPKTKVVVRPHPSENKKYWEKILINEKNCYTEYFGSVFPWIIASEFVVQNRCSTGIESFLIGKKCISFDPIYKKYFMKKLYFSIGKIYTKLSQFTKSEIEKRDNLKKNNKYIKYHIHNLDSVNSLKIILKEINKFSEIKTKNIELKFTFKDMIVNLYQTFFGSRNSFETYSFQKIGLVKKKLINTKLKKILLIEKIKKKINIKQIGKKMFLLNFKI